MVIKSLRARNYRQHRELDFTFDGNTIGLIGENGTGKSNCLRAMNYLFEGVLAGETRDSTTKKLPIVRWGAESGYVEGTFEHHGVEGEIKRTFSHKKVDAYFKYGDIESKGTKEVNAAIAEHLGIDKDICRQAIFVGQDELDDILFTEPSKRKQAWQKLCGIGQVNDIHAKLGKVISAQPALRDYDENIMEAELQRQSLNAQMNSLSDELLRKDINHIDELIKEKSDRQHALEQLNSYKEKMLTLSAEIDKLNEDIAFKKERIDSDVNYDTDKLSEELQAAVAEKIKLEKAKFLYTFFCEQTARLKEAEEGMVKESNRLAELRTPEQLDKVKEACEKIKAEIIKVHQMQEMNHKLKEMVESGNVASSCALCGQVITDINEVKAFIRAKREELNSTVTDLTLQFEQTDDGYSKEYDDYHQTFSYCRHWKLEQEKAHKELEKVTDEHSKYVEGSFEEAAQKVQQIESMINDGKANYQRWQAMVNELGTVEKDVIAKQGNLDGIIKECKSLCAKFEIDPAKLDEDIAAGKTELEEMRKTSAHVNGLKGEITQMKRSIETLNGTIQDLKDKKEAQASSVEKMDKLQSVRDWFHYNNGPSVIINNLLDEITVAVNDFLEKFDSLFAVIPNYESMSFNYYYHDPDIPIADPYPHCSEMSGGEKVVLAVAFRLATYAMFAQRVGLLVLDEPSVYLDSNNVGKLGTLLYNIKSLAQNLGLQVFISTHEQSLMNHFDMIVDFGSKNKHEKDS